MAAKNAPIGISHLTVIPSNFEPAPEEESDEELIFDLDADPDETTDLSTEPDHQEELATWRERLVDRLSEREEGFVVEGELSPGSSE